VLGLALGAVLAAAPLWAQDRGRAEPIPEALWQKMVGVSWHPGLGCPERAALRLLTLPFVDFTGARREGRLIAAAQEAEALIAVFAALHAAGFPIQQMRPVHEFGGDDALSMAANNTSAFNCRRTTGGGRLSDHAYGAAVDINPVQNPYVGRHGTQPLAGQAHDTAAERAAGAPGVIRDGDAVVRAFAAQGWGWGGHWRSVRDYQHFSRSGR
jgi:poly-gamma-glutamate synthesis protein (capsule biosynthesis protein)